MCGIQVLTFSPDGSRLTSSGQIDETVRLWDGTTGLPIATLEGHSGFVSALSFSPDGSRLASLGLLDGTVRLWDGFTGVYIATLEGHREYGNTLSFSLDGSQLAASGSMHGNVGLWNYWDGAQGHLLGTLDLQPDWYSSRPVPCEVSISLGELNETSRRYHIQSTLLNNNNRIPLLWLPADTAHITRETFCNKSAAFGCEDGRLIIFDLSKFDPQEIA